MQNKTFIFLVFLMLNYPVLSQPECDIKNYYGDFIKIENLNYDGQYYLFKQVIQPDNQKCYSHLLDNPQYIEYLLTHFSSNSNESDLMKIKDSTILQMNYIEALKKDTIFNNVMNDLCEKVISHKLLKDTVSLDEILNIAVKYFSIVGLNEDGYFVGKVCSGINDIEKTEKKRKPLIEAFCFSSILKNYQSDEFNLHSEFVNSIKELYKVNLGVNPDEKLLRAQGGMYFLMMNNDTLIEMIKSEYNLNKEILPFILKD